MAWPPTPRSLSGHYNRRYESLVPEFYTSQRSVPEDRLGTTTQPVVSAVTRICSVGLMPGCRTSCHKIVSFLIRAKATAVPFFRTHTDRRTYVFHSSQYNHCVWNNFDKGTPKDIRYPSLIIRSTLVTSCYQPNGLWQFFSVFVVNIFLYSFLPQRHL
jgi:hypothetical protein